MRAPSSIDLVPQTQGIPKGYVLVPLEPTDEMYEAINNSPWLVDVEYRGATKITTERRNQRYIVDGWRAMLEAAPKHPAAPEKDGD